ncbi:transposase, partial [Neisseria gonorrhoeae]
RIGFNLFCRFDEPGISGCSTLCRYRKFRYARAAYFGLLKVGAQSHLKAMCLNLLKAANRLSAPAAA